MLKKEFISLHLNLALLYSVSLLLCNLPQSQRLKTTLIYHFATLQQFCRSEDLEGLYGILCIESHKAKIKALARLISYLEALEKIHFQVHSQCCQISVPCGYSPEVPVPLTCGRPCFCHILSVLHNSDLCHQPENTLPYKELMCIDQAYWGNLPILRSAVPLYTII